jgi:3',5'-cyclic AMP phosphodiesterase CpdA
MKDTFIYLDDSDRQLALNEDFSFIVLGDVHTTEKGTNGLDALAEVMAENGDSFIVVNGDITQSGKENELEAFLQTADSFNIPCYPVIGNHDIYFGDWKVWKKMIGSTVYRIDAGNTTLIMLDSANSSFGVEQLKWLKKQLNTSGARTFVFTHANLFTSGGGEFQQLSDFRERARIMSLLEGKCTAFFSGHSHTRDITETGGVRYITLEDFKSNGTYCRVKISSGKVSYEIKSIDD